MRSNILSQSVAPRCSTSCDPVSGEPLCGIAKSRMRRVLLGLCALLVAATLPSAQLLAQGLSVGGKATDLRGRALAGARATLFALPDHPDPLLDLPGGSQALASAVADPAGRFLLEAPGIGMYRVVVEAPGRLAMAHLLMPLVDSTELAAVELRPARKLSIEVRGSDGQPADAIVALVSAPESTVSRQRLARSLTGNAWRPAPRLVRTDDQGKATLWRNREETLRVEASALGYQAWSKPLRSSAQVQIALQRGEVRELLLVDNEGRAVAGGQVQAPTRSLANQASRLLPLATSDAQGRARLVLEPQQKLTTIIHAPGGLSAEAVIGSPRSAAAGDGNAETAQEQSSEAQHSAQRIVLQAPARMRGRVVDRLQRSGIVDALVWHSAFPGGYVRTDAQGIYELPRSRHGGSGSLQAAARGYVPTYSHSISAADDRGPALVLDPAAMVSGVVVDAQGKPVAEVEVQPRSVGRGTFQRFNPRQSVSRARTTAQGRFNIHTLPAQTEYALHFQKPGFASEKVEIGQLQPFERRGGLRVVLSTGSVARGMVVDDQDQAIAGATARLVPAQGSGSRRFTRLLQRTLRSEVEGDLQGTTDREGRFEVSDLNAGRYDLEVEATGFAPATIVGLEIGDQDQATDLGIVALSPEATIEGVIVDSADRPVAGARVQAASQGQDGMIARMLGTAPEAQSATDGSFRLGGHRSGQKVELLVDKEGFAAHSESGVVAPTAEPLRIQLAASARLSGRVLTEEGSPVSGAMVHASPLGAGQTMIRRSSALRSGQRSDADGQFLLQDIQPGRLLLMVSAQGYQSYQQRDLEIASGGHIEGLEVVLRRGATVEGTVLGPDGRPAIDTHVRAYTPSGGQARMDGLHRAMTTTDGDGYYRLEGLPLGAQSLSAEHRDYQRSVRNIEVESGVNTVDLVLEGGVPVSGQVVGPEGQPISGAQVRLQGQGLSWRSGRTQSQADGSFEISNVPKGSFGLVAEKEGYGLGKLEDPVQVQDAPVSGLVLQLAKGIGLSGQILGLDFDQLAQVRVMAYGPSGAREGQVDFEGRYRIENLSPGTFTIDARLEGSGRQTRDRINLEEGQSEASLDLEFLEGFALSGLVRQAGQPLPNTSVQAWAVGEPFNSSDTTDGEGRFRLEDLPAGNYRLQAEAPSGLHHWQELNLDRDRSITIDLRGARLSGNLRDAETSSAIEGAQLRLEPLSRQDGGGRQGGAQSDSRGFFSFGDVAEGSYTVHAEREGYAGASLQVEVRAGEAKEDLLLELQPTEGLTFTVRSGVSRPQLVNVAFVDAEGNSNAVGAYPTSTEGRVRVGTLPAGSYRMHLSASGSGQISVPVVAPGDAGHFELPAEATLRVRIPELEGQGISAVLSLVGSDGQAFATPQWGGRLQRQWTVRNGSVLVEGLPPGSWQLTVNAGANKRWTGAANTVAGTESEVTLR